IDHQTRRRTALELRDAGDIEIKFIPKETAYRRVGTRIKRLIEKGRKQRQRAHEISALLAGEIDQALQIGKIPGAPVLLGGESVQRAKKTPESRIDSCSPEALGWR